MGTQLNEKYYTKLIDENIAALEKHMPQHSLEKKHTIEVLKWSIKELYHKQSSKEKPEQEYAERSLLSEEKFMEIVHKNQTASINSRDWALETRFDFKVIYSQILNLVPTIGVSKEAIKQAYQKWENDNRDASGVPFFYSPEWLDTIDLPNLVVLQESKWIRFDKTPPDKNIKILCTNESNDIYKAEYDNFNNVWRSKNSGVIKVFHWMPLPEPPKPNK